MIALAALAAMIGDNAGYLIARKAGRRLLERPGVFARRRRQVLDTGEPFFERHGPKAVFFGRWIVGLRTWASWLAGAARMPWRAFALWNAIGGISWATTVGLAAYLLGQSASSALAAFAIFGAATAILTAVSALIVKLRRQRGGRPPGTPTLPVLAPEYERRSALGVAQALPAVTIGSAAASRDREEAHARAG